jgi:formylglycine-generating enzyme required for sulfatase activity
VAAPRRSRGKLLAGGAAALIVGAGVLFLAVKDSTPVLAASRRCQAVAPALVWVPGGEVTLGSESFEPEEAPVRRAWVGGFWMDRTEVTNDQFAAFVRATGYVTVAERPPVLPAGVDVPPEMREPGGIVFHAPRSVSDMVDVSQWWRWTPGASWRRPEGPGSSIAGRGHHPVLQVAYEDALAYARWKGHALPSEAQWEYAARGGAQGRNYIWGDEAHPSGRQMANSWQGVFPVKDTGADGFASTAPVGCYEANGYGLYDMAGNVWEWSNEGFGSRSQVIAKVGSEPVSIRGGSWLCAPNFCGRFRPSARQPGDPLTGTTHIGFRTIKLAPGP